MADKLKCAAYLIGQGTYFRPSLIELQYYRILRHIDLLHDKTGDWHHIGESIYVDLFPRHLRTGLLSLDQLPQFRALLNKVENGVYTSVIMDVGKGHMSHYGIPLRPREPK